MTAQPFRIVEAFAFMSDERHIAAQVVFSDHPDADPDEPTVFVVDRERETSVSIPLSLFRIMARSVEGKV